ncbi:MAG TPA: hypothetical protein VMK42_17030 [Anaeromyxobacteraceae bacterium]|nr:hypothetical protein [Anaeromyxobacteraceae bacterium]
MKALAGRDVVQFRVPPGSEEAVRDLLRAHQRYQGLRGERSLLTLGLPLVVGLSAFAIAWPDRCASWVRALAFGGTLALLVAIPVVLALELGAYRRMVRTADALGHPAARAEPGPGEDR